jgi:hypothetical protein
MSRPRFGPLAGPAQPCSSGRSWSCREWSRRGRARDLRECLLLQIRPEMPHAAASCASSCREHLEDLAGNRMPLIEKKTGFSIAEIERLRHELHSLHPKPGAMFTMPYVPAVKPDVHVEQQADGSWKVRLEDVDLPNLRISPLYREMLLSPGHRSGDPRVHQAEDQCGPVADRINRAAPKHAAEDGPGDRRSSDAVSFRGARGDRAAQDAADRRPDRDARDHRQPGRRRQMAADAARTVCAAAILRRRHVSADGEEVAWDAVRIKLQEIIDAEPKDDPYSDDALVEELAKGGITVARRTVTKYRKAMDIPSSRQRRDWKMPRPGSRRNRRSARWSPTRLAGCDGGEPYHAASPSTARGPAMRCPFCRVDNDRVIDSRAGDDGASIRRRRECVSCRRRFTTYERVERQLLAVVKKEGQRSPSTATRSSEASPRPAGSGL